MIYRISGFRAAAAIALILGGCGDDLQPYDAVSTSPHFQLFLHDGATPAANALDRLEAHYRDTRAYVGFPEVIVDYHLYPSLKAVQRICGRTSLACAFGKSVYSSTGVDTHELIHAYMASVGSPNSVLQEGIAVGIKCGVPGGLVGDVRPWREAVTQTAHSGVPYLPGFALFKYLVQRFGIERFVEYYGRARFTLDPEVFADDFQGYWGISVDTAWAEMVQPNGNRSLNAAICPCTQPDTLVLDGSRVTFERAATLIVPLPDADPGPYLFSAEVAVEIRNCAQDYLGFPLAWRPTRAAGITAARVLPERHFLMITSDAAVSGRKGDFLAASCVQAVPIAIAPEYNGDVTLLAARGVADPAAAVLHARLSIEGPPRTILFKPHSVLAQTLTVCPACDAPETTCTTVTRQAGDITVTVAGPDIALRLTYALEVDSTASATMTFLP